MTSLRVAAVQASYVLMDQAATLDRVAALAGEAAFRFTGRLSSYPQPCSAVISLTQAGSRSSG
jgi:hypothetical protein